MNKKVEASMEKVIVRSSSGPLAICPVFTRKNLFEEKFKVICVYERMISNNLCPNLALLKNMV